MAAPSPTTPRSRWASRPATILGKIAGYLKEAGTDKSRVVSTSIFVTDLSKKKEMDAVWTEFFGDNLPTRATVGAADLGGSALIEVVVTALKG
ncbi:enamine deaminase RidA (YjgF/YER057c/UK114 family) [Bradyrhizobium sp. LM3.4]